MTNTIGHSIPRIGARERVTGAQKYTADLPFPGALHVQLVHLDAARLAIRKIRRDYAARVPGVVAIFTADDLPQPMPRFGPAVADRPLLAEGETRFFGEPVAVAAAETVDAAREAAMLLREHIEAEELPPVITVEQALDPASPLVQPPDRRPNDPNAGTNILREWTFGWGTPPERAHLVLEREYRFPMVTHFAIEPHAFAAAPDESGVTIWSPTQHPFVLQRVVAACLGHFLPVAVLQRAFQRVEHVEARFEAGTLDPHECVHRPCTDQVGLRAQPHLAQPGGGFGTDVAHFQRCIHGSDST